GKEGYKNIFLWIGILQGLGSLFYFKYLNHFLPLGLSFYTFKTLSYLLDIRKGKIRPTTDWIVFFSYISFFPCLISGPIDRPGALIPQLETRRTFEYDQASDGMRQILWGLFKKVVIADNCAVFSGDIFDHYKTLPASALLYGAFLVTIQVYADFSAYSDMAIGLGRLIGFNITRNFNYPFFARNIADFWRRWHITLTSWLTDYVFSPLTIYFRNYGKAGLILAILITFTAIGIWHGPNWTFVVFGFLHGCYYIPLILRGTMIKKQKGIHMAGMAGTFLLVMLTFVIFRSASLDQAFDYYRRLISGSIFSPFRIEEKVNTIAMLVCIVLMFVAEWLQRDKQHAMQIDFIPRFPVRALFYFSLILIILTFGPTKSADFIYFKF
ncbi:MAG TPA: MBOAT family O-acyltransferase, partial [Puia sp.]|nr:MBOAT family O-acyltransferase [Puia sp.]